MRKLIFAITILAIFNGCQKKSRSSDKNILNLALTGEISTLDPANSYDGVSSDIVYQVYEQLYEYHYLKRPYKTQPLLADGMPVISNNGTRYTIKIKKNVRYHKNEIFGDQPHFVTAHDFINQIKRLAYKPTRSNGWWIFDGKIKGLNKFREEVGSDFLKFQSTSVSGLQAPDDHTLIIDLTENFPQMIYALSMSFTSPMPIEATIKYENLLNDKVIGTGPFYLDKWVKLSSVKLKKFPHYRDSFYPKEGDRLANSKGLLKDSGQKIPFVDGINLSILKEDQTRWLNFLSNKVDLLSNIPKDNYSSAVTPDIELQDELKKKGIKMQIFPTLTFWWLSFNMNDAILGKNKNLRLAIAHAINNAEYIERFTNNIGQQSNSIFPPGVFGYSPLSKLPYDYNIQKAKEFLAKAGYPEGKGLPVFDYDERGTNTMNRQRAEFVQLQLKKIGIQVRPSINTFPAFLKKSKNGKLQFWQDGWAMDYPDVENILQLLVSKNHPPGPNATSYSNPKFDKLFLKLKQLPDGEEKKKLAKQMEQIILDEVPWVMQYYQRRYTLYHSRLKNYRHSDLINNYMKYLRVD